jgi:C4-dicarboxylate-specific signal transduction histidine kinase
VKATRGLLVLLTHLLAANLGGLRAFAQRAVQPTRVLLIYQQQAEAPAMVEFTQRLRETVRDGILSPVEFYQESLDLDRFAGRERWPALERYFTEKYRGVRIDVVVPVGGVALRFATERLHLLGNAPIVFALGATPLVDVPTLPSNVTGRVAAPPRFSYTLSMARRLQPDAERVVIVGGIGTTDSASVTAAIAAARAEQGQLPLVALQGLPLDVLLVRLHRLPRRTIVLFANFRRDPRGQAFDPSDVIGELARASAAPVYAQLRSYIGEGVVGGSMIRFDDEGVRTGRLIVRVLHRQAAEPMPPVETIGHTFVADWRQLRRWGLSENRLPPGTQILYRQPSPWERYRNSILGVLALVVAQSVLIAWLLLERRRRIRSQLALEEQTTYERTLAALTAQAAHHARPEEPPGALEATLGTLATYAGAETAILVQLQEDPSRPPTRLVWNGATSSGNGAASFSRTPRGAVRLELPLVSDGIRLGAIELYRANNGEGWSDRLVSRLDAAVGLIASAMARARAELRADETRRQIAHMARVAMIGELAATISHELRQPLCAIRSNAQAGALLLARRPHDVNTAQQIFQDIGDEGVRASEVIDNIRMLLRKEQPAVAGVDVNDVCRHAVRLLQGDAKLRHTRLELLLDPAQSPVVGDAVQLQQVVLNLALNALDAASGSSSPDRAVTIQTVARDASMEVSVHDTGNGLAPGTEHHLFEPFFSTKTSGLGLGLVIVRSIVERHNGRVLAENHPLGGAVFRVVLPSG